MTLEEKLTYMQTVSMEQARAEGNAIIDAHREALEKIFNAKNPAVNVLAVLENFFDRHV